MISKYLEDIHSESNSESDVETIKWHWLKAFKGLLKFGILVALIAEIGLNFSRIDDFIGIPLSLLLLLCISFYTLHHFLRMLDFSATCVHLGIHRRKVLTVLGIYLCVYICIATLSIPHVIGNPASDDLVDESPDYSYLATSPMTVEYNYTLHGKKGTIPFTVYEGVYTAIKEENDGAIFFGNGISKQAFDDPRQAYYLDQLVSDIQEITPNKDDQARIAISLVQNIEYDDLALGQQYSKYPYEVLYTQKGVCAGKSALMAYLLRGLGYEVVLFHFVQEEHAAVGIACPQNYSFRESGYCYVESTSPCPITYAGDLEDSTLTSYPYIRKVSDGTSFDSVEQDYYNTSHINHNTSN